jgi:hypothetical protein
MIVKSGNGTDILKSLGDTTFRKLLALRHAPRRNRTYNPVIKSHLLCQLS